MEIVKIIYFFVNTNKMKHLMLCTNVKTILHWLTYSKIFIGMY